jgi:hypothetical protein
MMVVLLAALSAHSAVLFSEDYESGQTIGDQPVGAASVRPSTNTSNLYTRVVGGVTNLIGTGNGVEIKDEDGADVSNLEYNFVAGTNDQLSAVQIDFSFAAVSTNGAGDDYIAVAVGEYDEDRTFGAGAARYLDVRLYNDGTIDFRNSEGAAYSGDNVLLADSNSLSIFVNDYDDKTVNYTGPDESVYVLQTNSVAYWLNGSLITFDGAQYSVMDLSDPTAGGTVGTTTNNLGKFGFNTGTSDTNLNYVIDNIVVSTIEYVPTPPPPALIELLFEDYETGQTVGTDPVGAASVRPSSPTTNIFTTVVDSGVNVAGSGNGVEIKDNDAADVTNLEYNFVDGTNSQLSAVLVSFSFSALSSAGAGDDYIAVSVGAYDESRTLGASAGRFSDMRLYNDGTVDFRTSQSTPYSANNAVLAGSNSVSMFINDYDSQSITYTGLDESSYTLPANSIAYWLNGSLVTMNGGEQYTWLDLGDATAGGTIGTSEDNLGKFGFNTGTSDVGLDYVIDNIAVYEIVQTEATNSYSAGWLFILQSDRSRTTPMMQSPTG